MRKSKNTVEEHGDEADVFEAIDSSQFEDSDGDSLTHDERRPRKPARQRVELRNEQESLRRQLSDWDDYEQEGFDTKL